MLFLAQPGSEPDFEAARSRLAKHAWIKADIRRAGPFQPDSVNSDEMRVFHRHYEECLEHGGSIVWYP